jgi:4-hydroxybenzoate polyprenyltransferase
MINSKEKIIKKARIIIPILYILGILTFFLFDKFIGSAIIIGATFTLIITIYSLKNNKKSNLK